MIAKEDVCKKFGGKSDTFFSKFVTPITDANEKFTDPFALNGVALAPIIEMGGAAPVFYRRSPAQAEPETDHGPGRRAVTRQLKTLLPVVPHSTPKPCSGGFASGRKRVTGLSS